MLFNLPTYDVSVVIYKHSNIADLCSCLRETFRNVNFLFDFPEALIMKMNEVVSCPNKKETPVIPFSANETFFRMQKVKGNEYLVRASECRMAWRIGIKEPR